MLPYSQEQLIAQGNFFNPRSLNPGIYIHVNDPSAYVVETASRYFLNKGNACSRFTAATATLNFSTYSNRRFLSYTSTQAFVSDVPFSLVPETGFTAVALIRTTGTPFSPNNILLSQHSTTPYSLLAINAGTQTTDLGFRFNNVWVGRGAYTPVPSSLFCVMSQRRTGVETTYRDRVLLSNGSNFDQVLSLGGNNIAAASPVGLFNDVVGASTRAAHVGCILWFPFDIGETLTLKCEGWAAWTMGLQKQVLPVSHPYYDKPPLIGESVARQG